MNVVVVPSVLVQAMLTWMGWPNFRYLVSRSKIALLRASINVDASMMV